MYITGARCTRCDAKYDVRAAGFLNTCTKCNGVLDIEYDYDGILGDNVINTFFARKENCIWRYRELLPLHDYSAITSIQEGNTGLIDALNLNKKIRVKNLYIKNESQNPTFSFKDRPVSVTISKAQEAGIKTIIAQSTGNAGASLAAYAAKAGIQSIILVPENTFSGKLIQMNSYGAKVIAVRGPCSNASKIAGMLSQSDSKIANLDLTFSNPYSVEGNKTIAYEISKQLEFDVPDWVFVPVGSGNLIYGIYKGFAEYFKMGLINKMPAIAGIQAENCAPIVKAFNNNDSVKEWTSGCDTIASGINDPLIGYTAFGERVLHAINQSKGIAISVSENDMISAIKMLAMDEGLFAEPAGACAIAAVIKALSMGILQSSSRVVCIMSSCGFKELDVIKNIAGSIDIPVINNLNELSHILKNN